jgi:pantoate--beta-alanine ligase
MAICTDAGVDIVFAPTPDVVYPDGDPGVRVSAGPLGDRPGGPSRPGHFDGMLTVVGKLLHLTAARTAYFGQKDAQQLLLIRRMVRDLDFPASTSSRCRPSARTRRPGDEQPQHLPHRVRPRGRALPEPRAPSGGGRRGMTAPRRSVVPPARCSSRSRWPWSTTSCSCTRQRSSRRARVVSRARPCSPSPARVGTTRLIDNTPVLVGPGGGRLDVFSDVPTSSARREIRLRGIPDCRPAEP